MKHYFVVFGITLVTSVDLKNELPAGGRKETTVLYKVLLDMLLLSVPFCLVPPTVTAKYDGDLGNQWFKRRPSCTHTYSTNARRPRVDLINGRLIIIPSKIYPLL